MIYARTVLTLGLGALAFVSAACGGGSDDGGSAPDGPIKTVEVDMVDVAFEPGTIEVATGETVRFVFTNRGNIRHEAFVGTVAEQVTHGEEMSEGGEGGAGHDGHGGAESDASKVTVDPGDTGEVETAFAEAGTYEIGCHEPGHYDADMKVTVEVS